MPKTKKQKEIEDQEIEETEDQEIEPEADEEIKSPKMLNLLSGFKGSDQDYTSFIYKKEQNKRKFCCKMYNEVPDPETDLQMKYGGGTYVIFIKDDHTNKLLDSVTIEVMQPNEKIAAAQPVVSESKKDLLEELKAMSEIVGGRPGNDDKTNTMLMKIMEMQTAQSEKFMKMQMESDQKFYNMIMQIQNKKSDLSEMLEIFSTLDALRGGGGNDSTVDKILSSPLIQPLAEKLIGGLAGGGQPVQQQTVKAIEHAPSISDYVESLPTKFIDKITPETSEKAIQILHEQNKNKIDIKTATDIILQILKNKEVSKNV